MEQLVHLDFPNGIQLLTGIVSITLNQNVTGVVTATSFVGDGSSLTGILMQQH